MKTTRLATALLAAGLVSGAAMADGLRFLPGLDAGFKAEPTIALSLGAMQANAGAGKDETLFAYGIDFNMNCGLIQTPANRIRTHVQINHANQDGIKATTFELSPRYTVPLGSGFSVGAGPVIGMVMADNGVTDKNLFGYGAVVGANFRKGMYYSGLDVRYMNTNERSNLTFENWTVLAKVGINF